MTGVPQGAKTPQDRGPLTPRQAEILALHDQGLGLRAIARKLGRRGASGGLRAQLDFALLKSGRSQ
jgi:DNA-binding CsgD family transcriptional regulator